MQATEYDPEYESEYEYRDAEYEKAGNHAIIGIPSIDLRDRHARIHTMAKLPVISSTFERSRTFERSSILTLLVLSSTFRHGRLFLATPCFRTQ